MKTGTKVFIVSFLCFLIACFLGSIAYLKKNEMDIADNLGFGYYQKENITNAIISKFEVEPKAEESFSSFKEAKEKSSRINFIILGMEDVRTDTLLLASFNKDTKKIDVISIPRDTYIRRKGYNSGEERKINSVYLAHGVDGIKQSISYIMGDIPIHHYITIDYEGVKNIVDIVGGVEVEVPFDMQYVDTSADPPLNIDIKKGQQNLDGSQSLNFIRWRKNNKNKGYIDGDLGRIKSQQKLLTSLMNKVKENIIPVIYKGFKYIKTDINLIEAISYGRNVIGMESESINFYTLPGKPEFRPINRKLYSYYIYNEKDVISLLKDIYNVN